MNAELLAFAKPDFPDWLSPMLVKELRQGLRSRVFLVLFVTLQIAMIFPAIFGLLDATTGETNEGATAFFWLLVTVPLMIAMPASGLSAIGVEKQGNTLEPLFLTRLTARRILLGKWVAIVGQTLLMAASILPFAVLRYYLGNVNLVSELQVLGEMLAGSALLTAMAVGLSPMVNRVGRILVPVVAIIGSFVGLQVFSLSWRMSGTIVRGGGGGASVWPEYVVIAFLGVLLAAVMFEIGASKIAPAAENHSTLKRLFALAAVVVALIYTTMLGDHEWVWVPVLFIVAVVSIGALCESISTVISTYRPFLRWGFPGRIFGWLFYPGWPAGFLFTLLAWGFAIGHLHQHAVGAVVGRMDASQWTCLRIYEVTSVGALLLPMALYRLARLKKTPAMIFYFGIQGVFCLLALVGSLHFGAAEKPTGFEVLVSCFPMTAICYSGLISDWTLPQQVTILTGTSVISATALLILAVRSWPAWRAIAKLEKAERNVPAAAISPNVVPPVAAD